MTQDVERSKKEIIDEVTSDSNMQLYWSMIAVDLDEDVRQEVLVEIIQLWLTIRGFSTAAWGFCSINRQISPQRS